MSAYGNSQYPPESSFDHYLKQLATCDVLSREQEIELFKSVKAGNKTDFERLVRANLRLVISIAFKYKNRGVLIHDLVEEGNVGLLESMHRFDLSRGCRFSTYASWWIRQKIEKAIMNQTRTIRLPVHVIRDLSRILRQGEAISQEKYSSNVSAEEISKMTDLDPQKITEVIRHRYDVLSLDQLLHEDGRSKKENSVKGMQDPLHLIEMSNAVEKIHEKIEKLSRVDQRIIKLRYGMDGRKPRSLARISEQLEVSREYVSRSISRSQRKLADMFYECSPETDVQSKGATDPDESNEQSLKRQIG